jgi:hypothetical protein
MDFRAYLEAIELRYQGPLPYILGDGQTRTLHYGGTPQFDPFLFIPIHDDDRLNKRLVNIRNRVQKQNRTIYCTKNEKKQGGFDCRWLPAWRQGERGEWVPDLERDIGRESKLVVRSIGELHITVAMGLEQAKPRLIEKFDLPPESTLQDILMKATLKDGRPLFKTFGHEGVSSGLNVDDIKIVKDEPIFGAAQSYSIPSIGGGMPPIAVLVPISCPTVSVIRKALELPSRPEDYVQHITIGFVAPSESKSRPEVLSGIRSPHDPTIARILQKPRGIGRRKPR